MFISAIAEISEAAFCEVLGILLNFAARVFFSVLSFFHTEKYDKVLIHFAAC